ncbi:hypothetical protein PUN28_005552 [Cardiocondyla obscurior]|uniref:Uncharacterized protein n=1 Tax=Cardiocondyla obscurior TaxID=286306 RepID=A0AAW2GJD9_9HYME
MLQHTGFYRFHLECRAFAYQSHEAINDDSFNKKKIVYLHTICAICYVKYRKLFIIHYICQISNSIYKKERVIFFSDTSLKTYYRTCYRYSTQEPIHISKKYLKKI